MRRLPSLLAATLASLLLGACGETGKTADTSSIALGSERPTITTASGLVYDGDDGRIRFYGHEADAADRQAIATLVERYYAAAAALDGTQACRLIHSLTIEATIETDADRLGVAKTCPAVMHKLFERQRHQLAIDNASLEVIDIRVGGATALVLLRFAKASEANHLATHREGSAWKLWDLLATHMP
jgi:hypothetical protein